MDYNATATLRVRKLDSESADELMERFVNYHPAVGMGLGGQVEVIMTFPADGLTQALSTAVALTAGLDLMGLEVMESAEWHRRVDIVEMPALVSVTEAAELLGVSRQAVLQRLEAGTLPGQRIGKVWIIARSEVLSRATGK